MIITAKSLQLLIQQDLKLQTSLLLEHPVILPPYIVPASAVRNRPRHNCHDFEEASDLKVEMEN